MALPQVSTNPQEDKEKVPIVSSFTQQAQELARILGVKEPAQIPPEVTPQEILRDIETVKRQTREYLERERERALEMAREDIARFRPEFQQIIATMANVGGFSQQMLDRLGEWFNKAMRVVEDIKVSYDQAIALGDIETARSLIQTKSQIYNSLIQERNLYVNTMANLLGTVTQLREFPYREQQLRAQTFAINLQAVSASMDTIKQFFASRLGKIQSEGDLTSQERLLLRGFSQSLANILGTDAQSVYRQLITVLSAKPKVAQVQAIAGNQGTLFITIDETGKLNYFLYPGFTRTTGSSVVPLPPFQFYPF